VPPIHATANMRSVYCEDSSVLSNPSSKNGEELPLLQRIYPKTPKTDLARRQSPLLQTLKVILPLWLPGYANSSPAPLPVLKALKTISAHHRPSPPPTEASTESMVGPQPNPVPLEKTNPIKPINGINPNLAFSRPTPSPLRRLPLGMFAYTIDCVDIATG